MPLTARTGLGHAFIDPAVKFIEAHGGVVRLNARVRGVWMEGGEVTTLNFADETVTLEEGDKVIFAIPPTRLKDLLPDIDPPGDDASILNIHYRLGKPVPKDAVGQGPFIGMIGSDGQWAFVRDDVISLTTSASHAIGTDDLPNDARHPRKTRDARPEPARRAQAPEARNPMAQSLPRRRSHGYRRSGDN